MTVVDVDALLTPLSEEAPCGPDLNMEGDTDYLVFRANIEGQLPASYFSFDPKSIDYAAEVRTALSLLERSRDLEILGLVERLFALGHDLEGFVSALRAITALLETYWESVHPQPIDGDYMLRTVPLMALDDRPTVVLPLQHLPLVTVERLGKLSYRDHLIASGELSPRDGESADADRVQKILQQVDLAELVARRDLIAAARADLARIREVFIEQAGYEQAILLSTLPDLLTGMESFLDGAIRERDPSQATTSAGEGGEAAGEAVPADGPAPRPQGAVTSHEDARRALAAASRYFIRHEPSSPTRLLIHQARQLMGLSFADTLAALAPSMASDAAIFIPGNRPIRLGLERLGERLSSEAEAVEEGAEDEEEEEEVGEEDEADRDEDGSNTEETDDSGPPADVEVDVPPAAIAPLTSGAEALAGANRTVYRAETRAEALALLDAVSAWYRVHEPASPIPVILDKARELASRDFASLMQDMIEE